MADSLNHGIFPATGHARLRSPTTATFRDMLQRMNQSETAPLPALETLRLGVIGLGYVGLPLAVEFSKKRPVVGFDINEARVAALRAGEDSTLEVSAEELGAAAQLGYSSSLDDLAGCNCYIVTVPTPIDEHKRPDLTPLLKASETVGRVLKRGDVVIYESPSIPARPRGLRADPRARLGLTYNVDFFRRYSPSGSIPATRNTACRRSEGDSGSTPAAADLVDALYGEIITAGTYQAESIRVAEADKVIENTQRDLTSP